MNEKGSVAVIEDGAIHGWFELSYASYLVLPRTVLQSLPLEWQDKFVKLLEEADDWIPNYMPEGCSSYAVNLRDDKTGRFVKDHLSQYERGRRRLPLSEVCSLCGNPMGREAGDTHKVCADYEACQADRDR